MKTVIESFLSSARRRHVASIGLDEGARAACLGLSAAVLLLLVGTQILDWYWPVLLFGAAFAIGAWRSRKRVLSDYAIATLVDSRLGLQDALSTAHYFRHYKPAPPELIDRIEKQAAPHLTPEALKRAMPAPVPRSAYVLAGIAMVAVTLLGVRYGVMRTLDLSSPIAMMEFDPFPEPSQVQASTRKSLIQERLEQQVQQLGLSLDLFDTPLTDEKDKDYIGALPTPGEAGKAEVKGDSTSDQESASDQFGSAESADSGDKDATGEGQDKAETSKQSAGGKPQQKPGPNRPDSSNFMEKMRDALANLMQKMKTQQPGQESQQEAKDGDARAGGQQTAEKGSQGQGKSSSEGQQSPDPNGKGEGSSGDQLEANADKAGEKNADRPGGMDAKSGTGKQDGSKEIREAEQLAAMGKISEIIGRRAAQMSGDMTVEVPSSKQQIRTAYTQRKAAHGDTGGEVDRDEIPLIFQPYIRKYFEEIRKNQPKKN